MVQTRSGCWWQQEVVRLVPQERVQRIDEQIMEPIPLITDDLVDEFKNCPTRASFGQDLWTDRGRRRSTSWRSGEAFVSANEQSGGLLMSGKSWFW